MVPPAYPTPIDASMAAAGKQHRKAVQSNYPQIVNQHYVAEEQMALEDLLQQLHVVDELAALDASLTSLFETAPNTDVTEHQQLVQFRSRVARRITRYGQLAKKLGQIFEKIIAYNSAQPTDDPHQRLSFHPRELHELDSLLKQHQQRLQKYKSQFAAWWQNTERHFHTMRMANFVCSVQRRAQTSLGLPTRDGQPGGPSRSGGPRLEPVRARATTGEQVPAAQGQQKQQEDASLNPAALQRPAQLQPHSQQLLQETGQAMAKEVQRMRATQEQLQQSSSALEQTEASYNAFRSSQRTGGAARLLFGGVVKCRALSVASFSLRHSISLALGIVDRAMLVFWWMWENWLKGTDASDDPVEDTTTRSLSFPVESFVSMGPPAVSELLATSAATVISAASSRSRSNTALETGPSRSEYPETPPEKTEERDSAKKASIPTKAGLRAGEPIEDEPHVYMQQHEEYGSQLKQGTARLSVEDEDKHYKAAEIDEFSEKASAATMNSAAISQRKRRPSGSPSGNLSRPSVAARQQ
ncbi:hypothetical protein, conserved [Eimeria brunetti]|uniref:Uncharacterized protein n=1 Tax=Eimeria brunetti TaxID=51314 RepID=U6LKP4_9EIME|nr:hypothetical protein, conserved [Eimeria brunetti]